MGYVSRSCEVKVIQKGQGQLRYSWFSTVKCNDSSCSGWGSKFSKITSAKVWKLLQISLEKPWNNDLLFLLIKTQCHAILSRSNWWMYYVFLHHFQGHTWKMSEAVQYHFQKSPCISSICSQINGLVVMIWTCLLKVLCWNPGWWAQEFKKLAFVSSNSVAWWSYAM